MAESEPSSFEHPAKILTTNVFYEALVVAGVVRRGERIRRVVIDAQASSDETGFGVVEVFVERYGDERLLNVIPSLTGVPVAEGTPAAEVTG